MATFDSTASPRPILGQARSRTSSRTTRNRLSVAPPPLPWYVIRRNHKALSNGLCLMKQTRTYTTSHYSYLFGEMKKLTISGAVLLAIGLGIFFFVVPKRVDRTHNFVYPSSPVPPRSSTPLLGQLLIVEHLGLACLFGV